MAFSPVTASQNIVEKYKRYLSTIFEINDELYQQQFTKALSEQGVFSVGPYLDVFDVFEKGSSITSLIENGQLPRSFGKINFPKERNLYKHQEVAIQKAQQGNNVVVSTGTGSGKTESFLIPILNHICREYEACTLGAGVRALIIYPMNALANDQMERLRELLKDFPAITYGSYTGQTKDRYSDAIAEYMSLNDGKEPKKNELICRDQMKESPPHIFITNYAMLEYLMLRPEDSVFFSAQYASNWKYIIMDEAHVYNGSTGIEVSMLLRRLKATLNRFDIQYILTSATLGSENSNREVARFASDLCDSVFDEENIVRAFRKKLLPEGQCISINPKFYSDIAGLLEEEAEFSEIADVARKYTYDSDETELESYLFDIIIHDKNYWDIRSFLKEEPKTVYMLKEKLNWELRDVENFVAVASKCEKNGDRLFDARYHMFLRATESVFITLGASKKLFLTRKEQHYESDGKEYQVFEIGTCTYCHDVFLIGKIECGRLVQYGRRTTDDLARELFLLSDHISNSDEDHLLSEENINTEPYEICTRCGFIRPIGLIDGGYCEHDKSEYIKVMKITVSNDSGRLTKCPSCEGVNNHGVLRMFFTGQEAVTSVIGTALFEELPSYKMVKKTIEADDETGFGFSGVSTFTEKEQTAKQFLAFSDSRQAAAFYATYLDQTYRSILYKRLVVEALKEVSRLGETVPQFVKKLAYEFEKHGIATGEAAKDEAWKAILAEIVDNNGSTSLSRMGLLSLSIDPQSIPENRQLQLSAKEVSELCSIFALGMMADAAIWYNHPLDVSDKELFTHNGAEYAYTLSDPDVKKRHRSFCPSNATLKNKRVDYFARLLQAIGKDADLNYINKNLEAIWNKIFLPSKLLHQSEGAYQIDTQKIVVSKGNHWYYCSKCKKLSAINIRGICPTYQCTGHLTSVNVYDKYSGNHYFEMYQNMDARELRIFEHTAQLDKETAYDYQKRFKNKEVDILSCSTTFEMGVDVGSLETVFMRNMPPSPTNYAQRAGRAGRSKHAAAYALTFCNKSNHDFTFFRMPERMIRGEIDPPKFNIENEKIAIRHLYASALSFFWKRYSKFFSTVGVMAETNEAGKNGFICFESYLQEHPNELKDFAKKFLPLSLVDTFKIASYGWIGSLLSSEEDNPGVLIKAIAEYDYELGVLQDAVQLAIAAQRPIDHLNERIRVYKRENILAFLSRKNVLPKYGFPVDNVEMTIVDRSNNKKLGVQLQRDLSIAISEYAPGSQIVANGRLITSHYIRKIPKMSWKMFDYIRCVECKTLNIAPHSDTPAIGPLETCQVCNASLNNQARETFLIPLFGFASNDIKKPGLIKPERTYNGEVSYVGYMEKINMERYQIAGRTVELGVGQGQEMAVLNESAFYICESCGYTLLDESAPQTQRIKKHKHHSLNGYTCANDGTNKLRKYSLGYQFKTDVVQIRFISLDLWEWEVALSVLYGFLNGICSSLNIESTDISGCLQHFKNEETHHGNFALILYDKTPGGAGHVRRLNSPEILTSVINETIRLMESCNCGGDEGDSSCYSCLRNYYNQKQHDVLKRGYVIRFLKELQV